MNMAEKAFLRGGVYLVENKNIIMSSKAIGDG
jgi:hypothetical protein